MIAGFSSVKSCMDGFGRGSGGFSIGVAVSVCAVAFCSPVCADEMSVINARATLNQSSGSLELQVLFDRGISNRHVNQGSILKPRDELVVFDRIEGDATRAPPEHAIIF